jgi:hypothetical protein
MLGSKPHLWPGLVEGILLDRAAWSASQESPGRNGIPALPGHPEAPSGASNQQGDFHSQGSRRIAEGRQTSCHKIQTTRSGTRVRVIVICLFVENEGQGCGHYKNIMQKGSYKDTPPPIFDLSLLAT